MNRKLMMGISALFMSVVLVACGGNENTAPDNNADTDNDSTENMDMDPSSSGEIPDDLADAENPTYPDESKAKIKADHKKGMDGAKDTIEGDYETNANEVSDK